MYKLNLLCMKVKLHNKLFAIEFDLLQCGYLLNNSHSVSLYSLHSNIVQCLVNALLHYFNPEGQILAADAEWSD